MVINLRLLLVKETLIEYNKSYVDLLITKYCAQPLSMLWITIFKREVGEKKNERKFFIACVIILTKGMQTHLVFIQSGL